MARKTEKRGHPHHEGGPRARALALGEVPRDDVLPRAGYEHDGVAPDPDAVEEDDVAHLAGPGGDRPYLPELPGRPLERGARAAHVGLGLLGEQPAKEQAEPLCPRVDLPHGRRAASAASPSLPARRSGPVPAHGAPAQLASRIVQWSFPSRGNFP